MPQSAEGNGAQARGTAESGAPVLVERRGAVLIITLNRPDARNAVNLALAEGIAHALDMLDGDAGLTAGILSGAG
ncbi:MAG: hypothetical protein KGJ43_08195, partial [Acidobacteriota bacterium]|nr:hypothetical protein [Acidobacteriota bacterium]